MNKIYLRINEFRIPLVIPWVEFEDKVVDRSFCTIDKAVLEKSLSKFNTRNSQNIKLVNEFAAFKLLYSTLVQYFRLHDMRIIVVWKENQQYFKVLALENSPSEQSKPTDDCFDFRKWHMLDASHSISLAFQDSMHLSFLKNVKSEPPLALEFSIENNDELADNTEKTLVNLESVP